MQVSSWENHLQGTNFTIGILHTPNDVRNYWELWWDLLSGNSTVCYGKWSMCRWFTSYFMAIFLTDCSLSRGFHLPGRRRERQCSSSGKLWSSWRAVMNRSRWRTGFGDFEEETNVYDQQERGSKYQTNWFLHQNMFKPSNMRGLQFGNQTWHGGMLSGNQTWQWEYLMLYFP